MEQNREPTIYAALFTSPDVDFTPERRMWIAVVGQALTDAASPSGFRRAEIEDWMESEDFEIVIDCAGMKVEYMLGVFTEIIQERNRKKAFRLAMTYKFLIRSYVEDHLGYIDLMRNVVDSRA